MVPKYSSIKHYYPLLYSSIHQCNGNKKRVQLRLRARSGDGGTNDEDERKKITKDEHLFKFQKLSILNILTCNSKTTTLFEYRPLTIHHTFDILQEVQVLIFYALDK